MLQTITNQVGVDCYATLRPLGISVLWCQRGDNPHQKSISKCYVGSNSEKMEESSEI